MAEEDTSVIAEHDALREPAAEYIAVETYEVEAGEHVEGNEGEYHEEAYETSYADDGVYEKTELYGAAGDAEYEDLIYGETADTNAIAHVWVCVSRAQILCYGKKMLNLLSYRLQEGEYEELGEAAIEMETLPW